MWKLNCNLTVASILQGLAMIEIQIPQHWTPWNTSYDATQRQPPQSINDKALCCPWIWMVLWWTIGVLDQPSNVGFTCKAQRVGALLFRARSLQVTSVQPHNKVEKATEQCFWSKGRWCWHDGWRSQTSCLWCLVQGDWMNPAMSAGYSDKCTRRRSNKWHKKLTLFIIDQVACHIKMIVMLIKINLLQVR